MKTAEIELYGYANGAPVMRDPDRQYPGVLIQGDDLLGYCYRISAVLREARGKLPDPTVRELEFLQEDLFDLLEGYTKVAGYPGIGAPPEKN